jgi:hypothetical protein
MSFTFHGQDNSSCLNYEYMNLRIDCSGHYVQPYLPQASVVQIPSTADCVDEYSAPSPSTVIYQYYENYTCASSTFQQGLYYYQLNCSSATADAEWNLLWYAPKPAGYVGNPCAGNAYLAYENIGTGCSGSVNGVSFRVDCSGNHFQQIPSPAPVFPPSWMPSMQPTKDPSAISSSSANSGSSPDIGAVLAGSIVGSLIFVSAVAMLIYYCTFLKKPKNIESVNLIEATAMKTPTAPPAVDAKSMA